MLTTRNGLLFKLAKEAVVLVAYEDGKFPDGSPRYSIGAGSQYPEVKQGDTITFEGAIERLYVDVVEREKQLAKLVKVELAKFMHDSLLSLLFNWGYGNLRASEFLRVLNEGSYDGAFDLWTGTKAGSAGLFARREQERRMFRYGDYGTVGTFKLFRGNPRRDQPGYLPPEIAELP